MSGVPKRLLGALDARDGHVCAWHGVGGCDPDKLVPHHRSNRGMGGSPAGNAIENLVWLCAEVNGLIESDAQMAARARSRGLKLPRNGRGTALELPVRHAVHGWVVLDAVGGMKTIPESLAVELLVQFGLRSWGEVA